MSIFQLEMTSVAAILTVEVASASKQVSGYAYRRTFLFLLADDVGSDVDG